MKVLRTRVGEDRFALCAPENFLESLALLWRMRYDSQLKRTASICLAYKCGWTFTVNKKPKQWLG